MSVKATNYEELTKIEPKDEKIAHLYWAHAKEMRPLIDSDDENLILRGLKFFIQLMDLNVEENPAVALQDYEFFPRLFDIFFSTEDLSILETTLEIMNKFADSGYLFINEEDTELMDRIAVRANEIYTTCNVDIYKQTFRYLLHIVRQYGMFTDILLENFYVMNSSEILLGTSENIPEKFALASAFFCELIQTPFDIEYIQQFIDFVELMFINEIDGTLQYILRIMIIIENLGYKVKITNINTEFLTKAISTKKGLKNLLDFLQMDQNRYVLDVMWEPQFRQLLAGACVSSKSDAPENIMFFLYKIIDYWKPYSDDLFITAALLLILNGSFLQRFAAALYIQKLFSFANIDFIIDVIHIDFFSPLNALLQETNDDLFEIGLNIAYMVAIALEKSDLQIEEIPKFNQIHETLEDIDETDLPEKVIDLFHNILSQYHVFRE